MVSLLLETGNFDLGHRDSYEKTVFDWEPMCGSNRGSADG
jgi:hypothetical protein